MSLASYSDLVTAISNWLGRPGDSIISAQADDFIDLCESRISYGGYGNFPSPALRIRAMETTADITINAATAALPTGFLGAIRFYLDVSPSQQMTFIPRPDFYRLFDQQISGQPSSYTIEGDNFVFGPVPDSTYTGKLLYWKKPTALSDSAPTNWLILNKPDVYLYGSLIEASPFLGADDTRLPLWHGLYLSATRALQDQDQTDRFGGSALMVRSDVGNP